MDYTETDVFCMQCYLRCYLFSQMEIKYPLAILQVRTNSFLNRCQYFPENIPLQCFEEGQDSYFWNCSRYLPHALK